MIIMLILYIVLKEDGCIGISSWGILEVEYIMPCPHIMRS